MLSLIDLGYNMPTGRDPFFRDSRELAGILLQIGGWCEIPFGSDLENHRSQLVREFNHGYKEHWAILNSGWEVEE